MKALFILALAALLAACSSTPDATGGVSTPADTQHWSVKGKVAIWAEDQRETANFEWQNCDKRYRIRLSGPLGIGSAIINGNPQEVSLQRGGEATLYADTPEELLAAMGWIMPVSALRYWLRGKADPRAPARTATMADNTPTLEQHGWLIEYSEGGGWPEKISMNHHSARLKWLLRDWENFSECPLP